MRATSRIFPLLPRNTVFTLVSFAEMNNQNLNSHAYTSTWHWQDKDISNQFKEQVTAKLTNINFKIDDCKLIEAVLHRRKGKLYLIFEVTLNGTSANGNTFSIYEWDHDTELTDMMKCQNKEDKTAVIKALTGIGEEMKRIHGKDLGVDSVAHSSPAPVKPVEAATSNKSTPVTGTGASGSVTVKDTFYCSNDQFIGLFTKPDMIRIWSRNILQIIQAEPLEGKLGHVHFKNVKPEILKDVVKVTMDWKLNTWKDFTTCTVTKNGEQAQATMKCPDKDMVTQIWKEKYFIAMKSMFGF